MRAITLEKTAKALSRKYRIKLECKGTKAYTDGKKIVIPYLGEDINEDVAQVLRGYCDHEIGHVKFSDFEIGYGTLSPALKKMTNQIEDFRIENLMGLEYAGVKKNLNKVVSHLMPETFDTALQCLWMEGRRQCCGQEFDIADKTSPVKKQFGDDIFERINGLKSEMDSLALARDMMKMIKEPPAPPEPEESKPEAGDDGEPESPEESEPETTEESDDTEPGEGAGDACEEEENDWDEEADEDMPAGSMGEDDDDSDETDPAEGGGDSDDSEDSDEPGEEGDEPGEPGDSDIYGDEPSPGETDPTEGSELDGPEEEEPELEPVTEEDVEEWEDVGDKLKDILMKAHDTAMTGYTVYDPAQDQLREVEAAPGLGTFLRLKADLGKFNALKNRIARAFVAKTQSRWVNDREEGKINGRKLASVKAGNRRVFREHHKGESRDTAITFLTDFSASMGHRGVRNEMKAVILFLETLKLTGIKSEVLAYTTRGKFTSAPGDTLYNYSRREKLYTGIFKSHDEVYGSKVKARIANFGNVARKENCDPCSVRVAHDRLVNRREKRKILFVLTDGAVENRSDVYAGRVELKRLVKEIEDKGKVEIICIDFASGDAKQYYSNVISVPRGGDIAGAIGVGLKEVFNV
jgi:hypothetical protein